MTRPFIVTAAMHFGDGDTGDVRRARINRTLVRQGFTPVKSWAPVKGAVVRARVDHGRWVGDCLTVGCNGAELVAPRQDFVCLSGCGGGPWTVRFPDQAEQIERALVARPAVETRNWSPGETVDDLVAENIAHTIGGD